MSTYLEWLAAEAEKDRMLRDAGMPELPRSKEEREAILSTYPPAERRRIRRAQRWQGTGRRITP
jgi:hypothetical protein